MVRNIQIKHRGLINRGPLRSVDVPRAFSRSVTVSDAVVVEPLERSADSLEAHRIMAAEIHSRPQSSRPVLLNKIEGHSDGVNAAVLIPKEDGVITVSEDRYTWTRSNQRLTVLVDFLRTVHVYYLSKSTIIRALPTIVLKDYHVSIGTSPKHHGAVCSLVFWREALELDTLIVLFSDLNYWFIMNYHVNHSFQ